MNDDRLVPVGFVEMRTRRLAIDDAYLFTFVFQNPRNLRVPTGDQLIELFSRSGKAFGADANP
jgi:hypothetical protein